MKTPGAMILLRALFLTCLVFFLALPAAANPDADAFEAAISEAKSQIMGDPVAAYETARSAEELARLRDDATGIVTSRWLQGEALNRMNRPGEAAPILDEAIGILEDLADSSKLSGDVLVARARTASALGDYATAFSHFQTAHDTFLSLGEERSRAIVLIEMGNVHADARDHGKAVDFYQSAGAAYRDDPQIEITRVNNIATSYRELGDLAAAAKGMNEALSIATRMGSPMLQARVLTNLAAVQLEAGQPDLAEASLEEARALEQAEPSGWEPFIDGVEARIALSRGQTDEAVRLIGKTFAGTDMETTPAPFMEFHEAAAEIYRAAGQADLALQHLEAFKRLDDQRRDVSASANTALLSAQFDFASQELQIVRLRTETLEKEAALQAAAARQARIVFGMITVLLVVMLSAAGAHYLSMRRSRNQIREANFQLSKSNSALEKALKAKSEFLATTSHEIRTPLNAILGMSQLLGAQRGLPGDVAERVSLIHSSGLTMKAVVDDILDMSKIETGNVSVSLEPCQIAETLRSTTWSWCDRADEKGICLNLDLGKAPLRATTDERKLRQIIFNLVSNSIKFTEAGEVSVSASLDASGEFPILEVKVTDTGCGIPEDKLELIFEPFQQVDSSTTRKHSGTGLGLAISRKLAEALGGELLVSSTPGKGSVFTLRLPVRDIEMPDEDGHGEGAGVDVVLLTANMLHQAILSSLLGEPGLKIAECEAPEEALDVLRRAAPRALLADVDTLGQLPHEIMEALLALCDRAGDCRIVLWMQEEGQADPAMLRLSGADNVVTGPFDAVAILSSSGLQGNGNINKSLSAA